MQTYKNRIKQNNDHTRILRIIRFRSSFKETFADRSTAISKLNFWESTFAYTVFNKEQNKQTNKQTKKYKYKKVTVTDQRKRKLYIVYRMLLK